MSALLKGKTALITNISTPLGYSIAQRLGFSGAQLFVSDSHDQKLRKAVHKLKELGLEISGAVVDVNINDHRKQLFQEVSFLDASIVENKRFINIQVENKYNGLDILIVNNPVNTIKGPMIDASKMQLDKTYADYLTTPFKLCQSAVPLLSKSK